MVLALNDCATRARLLSNRATQTNDLRQRPKLTLVVSLKHHFRHEDIHLITKWLVYFCYRGLPKKKEKRLTMTMKSLNNSLTQIGA